MTPFTISYPHDLSHSDEALGSPGLLRKMEGFLSHEASPNAMIVYDLPIQNRDFTEFYTESGHFMEDHGESLWFFSEKIIVDDHDHDLPPMVTIGQAVKSALGKPDQYITVALMKAPEVTTGRCFDPG